MITEILFNIAVVVLKRSQTVENAHETSKNVHANVQERNNIKYLVAWKNLSMTNFKCVRK